MSRVDDYIDALPEDRMIICSRIREMIISLVPGIEERFSFKLPFYHFFGMFMYLSNTKDGITVSFCRGKDLVELFPGLQQKNRSIVASITISSGAEVHSKQLQDIILTAASWNCEARRLKIPMVRSAKKENAGVKGKSKLRMKK